MQQSLQKRFLSRSEHSLRLEENVNHQRSKPENPSMESNPHLFGLPIDNPHRYHQKEEEAPHLHTGDSKNKALATTLSETSTVIRRPPLDMQWL
jgi:hypothetical protein